MRMQMRSITERGNVPMIFSIAVHAAGSNDHRLEPSLARTNDPLSTYTIAFTAAYVHMQVAMLAAGCHMTVRWPWL